MASSEGPPPRKRARPSLRPSPPSKSLHSTAATSRSGGSSSGCDAAELVSPSTTSAPSEFESAGPTSTSTSTGIRDDRLNTKTKTTSETHSPPSTPTPIHAAAFLPGPISGEQAQVTSLSAYRLRDMPDAEVYHVPEFISRGVAGEWYEGLVGLDSWYQPKLKVYGREVLQSRKIAAYTTSPSLTLKYSGQLVNMHHTYPPLLRLIQDRVEELLGVEFNHVMLNLYEDGGVYIGRHRDNLENRVMASLSLGAPRTFVMTRDLKARTKADAKNQVKFREKGKPKRSKPDSDEELEDADEQTQMKNDETSSGPRQTPAPLAVDKKTIVLQPGSLVVMQGETQKWWKHEIPKEPKIKEGRISLTFRQLEQA